MKDKLYTIGIDVGSSNIKAVLMQYSDIPVIIDKKIEKIRKRNPEIISDQVIDYILEKK